MLFSHNVHTVLKFWSGFVFAGMMLPNFGSIKNLSQLLNKPTKTSIRIIFHFVGLVGTVEEEISS